ncbi:MAG: chitobiase/beta-hexosaminidase C-terminal domain-containing protein [bacterium]
MAKKFYQTVIIILIICFFSGKVRGQWQIVGRWPYGSCNTVIADSDCVYIGVGGMIIITDMSDPSNPLELSRIETPGTVLKLFKYDSYLYVANKTGGLRIIDINDPLNPREISSFERPIVSCANAIDVSVVDNYAYLAFQGLYIFNIRDPSNPTEVNHLFQSDWIWDVHVSSGYAYLTMPDSGFCILDICDPENPVYLSNCLNIDYGSRIYVHNNYAYITDTHTGLYVVDISNPNNPIEVSHINSLGYAWDVHGSGNYIYVSGDNFLFILDIRNPLNPIEISKYTYADVGPSDWEDLYVFGNYAYVTFTYGGLRIIDISDPLNPKKAGYFETSGSAMDIFVSDNYAYVANNDFYIIDISELSNPFEIGSYNTLETHETSVYVSGNYAYVSGNLNVYDISIPQNPLRLCTMYNGIGDVRYQGIRVSGNYAYFLGYAYGLRILDVRNPSNPIELGSFNIDDEKENNAVYVYNDYAYITYGSEVKEQFRGLRIINVNNPKNPFEVSKIKTSNIALGIYVYNDNAYLTTLDSLYILDINDPENPMEINTYPKGALEVYATDYYVYLANPENGLRILDIKDPLNPVEVKNFREFEGWGIHMSNNIIGIVDFDYGTVFIEKDSIVFTPTFNPSPGVYTAPISTIYYTINGTTPSDTSIEYNSLILISDTTTLKAKAYKSDFEPSQVAKGIYYITGTVETPKFNPEPGTYDSPIDVTISCSTNNAIIRYTIDESIPDESSPIYTSPIHLDSTTIIKAKAYLTDWTPSNVGTAHYIIDLSTEIESEGLIDFPYFNTLLQNYPNPFNPITTIRFGIPKKDKVTIKIYDILGREIITLVEKNFQAGWYNIIWDGTDNKGRKIDSGLYIYILKAGDFIKVRKLLFLK